MNVSLQTQAILLLTAWFSKPGKNDPKPLTPTEWGRFALWLKDKNLAPDTLLRRNDLSECLQGWQDRTISFERVSYLLGRGGALGLALEKWQRAGLWVMTRSDPDYPNSLKKRLKFDAPPVFYGCGNRQLLDRGGIAVIGSRDATAADLAFTSRLGGEISIQAYSVISGGARGVDETAMLGALEKEGTVVGILSDSLLRAATSVKYRRALLSNNLVLASPFNPEAGFDVGNAMARNKYIYCLSDAAIVISTSNNRGGTWSGAIENLKKQWVPLWVKQDTDPQSGNAALVEQGARWLPAGPLVIKDLLSPSPATTDEPTSLFSTPREPLQTLPEMREPETIPPPICVPTPSNLSPEAESPTSTHIPEEQTQIESLSIYDFFMLKLTTATRAQPQTIEALQ